MKMFDKVIGQTVIGAAFAALEKPEVKYVTPVWVVAVHWLMASVATELAPDGSTSENISGIQVTLTANLLSEMAFFSR